MLSRSSSPHCLPSHVWSNLIPRHPRCHQPPSNRSATCGTRLPRLPRCLPSFSAAFPALLQPSPAAKATFASHWQDSLHASPQPVPTSQHHRALPPSTAPNAGPRPRRRRIFQRASWPALHLGYACGFATDQVTFDLLDVRGRRPQVWEQT
jgi:hypothetical protein